MGCDIHYCVQIMDEDDVWRTIPHRLDEGRDYRWFSALCGVRSRPYEKHQGLVGGRGLPEDATGRLDTRFYREATSWSEGDMYGVGDAINMSDCPDLHSTSWFYPDEIEAMRGEFEKADQILALGAMFGPRRLRILVAFDN